MGFPMDFFDGASDEPLNCGYGADSFLSFRRALDRDWRTMEEPQVYAWTLSSSRVQEETYRPLTLPPAIRLSTDSVREDVPWRMVFGEDEESDLPTECAMFVEEVGGACAKDTVSSKESGPYGNGTFVENRKEDVGVSTLHEGYRHRMYRDPQQRLEIPVVVAAVSAPRLLSTFLTLSDVLDSTVDLVLETSRGMSQPGERRDYLREQMDLPVLQSLLWEHEAMLMNDGRMGLAILDSDRPLELQLDEHKLIYIYTHEPEPFERCLRDLGIFEDDHLEVVTQRSHCHGSSPEYARELERLVRQVCAEEMA